ncbi:MAG TPA: hypothetical protein VLM89_06445 [Phycisphaerae bacterium]|nr:hypothetical protein [Phycisphaerae bacterium]
MNRLLTSLILLLVLCGVLPAQEPAAPKDSLSHDERSSPSPDAQTSGLDASETLPPEAPPPPSEEVMRPTRGGLRLTPSMMKLGARIWLQEGPFADVDFDERQQEVLSEKFGRRVMEAAHERGEQVRGFLEAYVECMFAGGGRDLTPEMRERFGEHGLRLVPAMRDLVKDFARDARPLLTDAQWERFKENLRREFQNIERAERGLSRWVDGEAREDENLDDLELEGDGSASGTRPGDGPQASRALWSARRRADADVRRLGPLSWREFLATAKLFFKFDERQAAQGEQLLGQCRPRAETVMTSRWRQRVRENRVKYHLRNVLKQKNLGPWVFHLENEYNELAAPLAEIEREFRDKVIALARPEQREAAMNEVRQRAAEHGLQFGDLDGELLKPSRE